MGQKNAVKADCSSRDDGCADPRFDAWALPAVAPGRRAAQAAGEVDRRVAVDERAVVADPDGAGEPRHYDAHRVANRHRGVAAGGGAALSCAGARQCGHDDIHPAGAAGSGASD